MIFSWERCAHSFHCPHAAESDLGATLLHVLLDLTSQDSAFRQALFMTGSIHDRFYSCNMVRTLQLSHLHTDAVHLWTVVLMGEAFAARHLKCSTLSHSNAQHEFLWNLCLASPSLSV
jgi:hypothetical protein